MITRLEAYRYRCFERLAVDLGAYNVLAGANGSGKTTLLDIPVLLGDMLGERLCSTAFLEALPSRGAPRAHTLTELIHQGRGDEFWLAVEAELPNDVRRGILEASSDAVQRDSSKWLTHLRYEVRFQVFEHVELRVLNEHLFLFPGDGARPDLGGGLQGQPKSVPKKGRPRLKHPLWRSVIHREPGEPTRYSPEGPTGGSPFEFRVVLTQPSLSSVPHDRQAFPAVVWFDELLREGVVFYEPEWRALRKASPPGQPRTATASGQNLPWLALDLARRDPERFGDWVEHVRTALPRVVSIQAVEREEDHHAYLAVEYRGYHVTSSGLSDGTLRILALTILPYLIDPPRLLVTEEPENGIHPRAVEAVLDSLRSLYDGQVWISTHSPIVIAHTDLAHILCARMNDAGNVEVVSGPEHPRLKEWKGTIDLGTLFAAGVLG